MGTFKIVFFVIICSFSAVQAKTALTKENIISCNVCGRVNKKMLESTGKDVEDPTVYPWLVALHQFRKYKWEYACMGSVITSWYILTAGHCIERLEVQNEAEEDGYCNTHENTIELCYYSPEEIKFAFVQDQGVMLYLRAAKIHAHPKYRVKQPGADIAIVKVNREIYCTATVSPICLSTGWRMDFKNVPVILAGFGTNHTRMQERMKHLKHTLLDVKEHETCSGNGTDVDLICTTGERYNGSSCHGDSGGPLMRYCDNTVYAIGVLSSGGLICSIKESDSYTRIFYYKDWIKSVVNLTHIIPYGDTLNKTSNNITCRDEDPREMPDSSTARSYGSTTEIRSRRMLTTKVSTANFQNTDKTTASLMDLALPRATAPFSPTAHMTEVRRDTIKPTAEMAERTTASINNPNSPRTMKEFDSEMVMLNNKTRGTEQPTLEGPERTTASIYFYDFSRTTEDFSAALQMEDETRDDVSPDETTTECLGHSSSHSRHEANRSRIACTKRTLLPGFLKFFICNTQD